MKRIGLLLIMLVVATSCGQQPAPTPTTNTTTDTTKVVKTAPMAKFELRPKQVEIAVGETFEMDAILTVEGGRADSVDMLVHYDPAVLEVVDMVESQDGIQVGTGELFGSSYIVNRVEDGLISVSAGTVEPKNFFEGSGTYATFTFKALTKTEHSPVYFDYDPSHGANTLDTDVILHDTASDIIAGTEGATVVVK